MVMMVQVVMVMFRGTVVLFVSNLEKEKKKLPMAQEMSSTSLGPFFGILAVVIVLSHVSMYKSKSKSTSKSNQNVFLSQFKVQNYHVTLLIFFLTLRNLVLFNYILLSLLFTSQNHPTTSQMSHMSHRHVTNTNTNTITITTTPPYPPSQRDQTRPQP